VYVSKALQATDCIGCAAGDCIVPSALLGECLLCSEAVVQFSCNGTIARAATGQERPV